jgi:uncharacterized protein (DUF2384 family)
MVTATIEGALVLTIPPTLLGPGSEYEKRHNALKKDVNQLVLDAGKIKQVTTPEELEEANNAGRVLQASTKEVELFYKPLKQQVDAFKAPLLQHEKEFAAPLDAEKRRLGGLITGYSQEVERKRQEEERKAREEAERIAREEVLNRAVEIEATEGKEAADQFLEEPIMAAPVVIQQEAPTRMAGQVGKTTYKCVVTDAKALLKAVANGQAPMQCFLIDQGWLDKKAALEKDGFNLPGCRLDKQASTHFRS